MSVFRRMCSNGKRVQTFVFVHDETIVLDYERFGKFHDLPEVKYVFVGAGSADRIAGKGNVIIARHLRRHIEQYPKFTSLTGWYALWKNELVEADYVNLFEYDINVVPRFEREVDALIRKKPDFIGYLPLPMSDYQYVTNREWVKDIIPAIKRTDGIDIDEMIGRMVRSSPEAVWSSTSNATFSRQCFSEYMHWFERLIDDLKESETCGHAHERSLSFFCHISGKRVVFAPKLMIHLQLDSHGTQGHPVDWKASMNRLLAGD